MMKRNRWFIWAMISVLMVILLSGCGNSNVGGNVSSGNGKNLLNLDEVNRLVKQEDDLVTVNSSTKLDAAMEEVLELVAENNDGEISVGTIQFQLAQRLDSFETGTAIWPYFVKVGELSQTPEEKVAKTVLQLESITKNHTYGACAMRATTQDGVEYWIIVSITM